MKARFGYDDALDVVGVHMVGGKLGALLTGVFASVAINSAGADGLLRKLASTPRASGRRGCKLRILIRGQRDSAQADRSADPRNIGNTSERSRRGLGPTL